MNQNNENTQKAVWLEGAQLDSLCVTMENDVGTPKVKTSYSMSAFRPSLLGAAVFNTEENVNNGKDTGINEPTTTQDILHVQPTACETPMACANSGVSSATPADMSSALKKIIPTDAAESPINLQNVFDEDKDEVPDEVVEGSSSPNEFPMDLLDEVSPLPGEPVNAELSPGNNEGDAKKSSFSVLEFDDEEGTEDTIDEDALRVTLAKAIRDHMSESALQLSVAQWCEFAQKQVSSHILQSISMAKLKSLVKPLVVEIASEYIMTHNATVEEQELQASQEATMELQDEEEEHEESATGNDAVNEELEAMRAIEKGVSARAAAVAALLQRCAIIYICVS